MAVPSSENEKLSTPTAASPLQPNQFPPSWQLAATAALSIVATSPLDAVQPSCCIASQLEKSSAPPLYVSTAHARQRDVQTSNPALTTDPSDAHTTVESEVRTTPSGPSTPLKRFVPSMRT